MSAGDHDLEHAQDRHHEAKRPEVAEVQKQGKGPTPKEVDRLASDRRFMEQQCRDAGPECADPMTNQSMWLAIGLLGGRISNQGFKTQKGRFEIGHTWTFHTKDPKYAESHEPINVTIPLALSSIPFPPPHGTLANAMTATLTVSVDAKQHVEAHLDYEFVDKEALVLAQQDHDLPKKIHFALNAADTKLQRAAWQAKAATKK